jgi:flavodoxin
MSSRKTLVICKSVHHGGTARVARRIAEVLHAEVAEPETLPYTILDDYDLVGFGSGVYYGRFHDALWAWLRGLPAAAVARRPAFVFSTSGLP